MLQSAHRLRHAADLKRVRKHGKTWRHPLLILVVDKGDEQASRFAFVASRHVGTAVIRNRAKRLLRESVRLSLDQIETGWDCLIIARPAIASKGLSDVQTAVKQLLQRAALWNDSE